MANKLRFRWGKLPHERKKRLVIDAPNGTDARLVLHALHSGVLRLLEERGYDLRTLKLEISKQEEDYVPLEDDCL